MRGYEYRRSHIIVDKSMRQVKAAPAAKSGNNNLNCYPVVSVGYDNVYSISLMFIMK